MKTTKTIDWPFIISLCNEENKPLAGIPVWLGSRFANTDLAGEALFLGLEPGDYDLGIEAADFFPLRKKIKIDRKSKNLGFILQGFATGGLKGNVHLSGSVSSLPDAEIKLTAVQPEETGAEEFRFWTDWDGNYSTGIIPVGEYEYHVNASLCQPKQGRLTIKKDTVHPLDVDLNPVPDPAKITVKVKTDSGVKVKKSKVRLLEGLGAVIVAEKDGTDTCVFTDIDRAPFSQGQAKEQQFISRNFVVAADIEGYATGYATGSLRSEKKCETVVVCRKVTKGEAIIKGIEEAQPAEVPLDKAIQVQIPCERKERFFKILLPHPGNVHVQAGPNPYNTFLRILDKDLHQLADTWNYANQPTERTVQSGAGELLLGISGEIRDVPEVFSALIVNYQPIIDPYQPNTTFESALPVEFGEIIRPFIFPQDDVNYFMVTVKRPGMLRVRLADCVIPARIRILNTLAEEIVTTWNYAGQPIDASCPVYTPGLYRIAFSGVNSGDYTLAPAHLKIDFIGTESSPGEFAPETSPPKPVRLGKSFGGTIFPGGKYNLYSFNVDRTGLVKIRFQLSGCPSKLRVLTGKGKEIYSSWNYAGQALAPDIAIHESGEYYIEVSGTDASQQSQGSFLLGVFFYPNDEYEGYKGNNSLEAAAEIHIGQEVAAAIEGPGDIDYYRFYVDHPGLLIQYTRTFPIHLHFIVSDPQGKEIFNSWNYAGQNLDREYHVLNCGYHTLRVLGTSPNDYSPASYGFRFELSRVKPESVQVKNKLVLNLNSGIKLDALIPNGIKSFMLPVTAPATVTIGAKIPVPARMIITGPDGRELFNSWNYSGQPLQSTLTLDAPATLNCTIQGTNPGDWSKECYFIHISDGDMPPEPALTLERIFEDNRKVLFNVSGTPANKHAITQYELDFEGSGRFKKVEPGLVEHSYKEGKFYSPRLRVTDDRGAVGTESMLLDLTDVTLLGMSCRVVFPQNGDIVSTPGKVFAQASSGPGKPVKAMKLYLDGRLLAKSDLPNIEAELAWKSIAPGEHTITTTACSRDGQETQDSVTFRMSEVFDLWPENGKVITGSRAVITWFSPLSAATWVEYRKSGEEKWGKSEGQGGKEHRVVLEGLDQGVPYEFRAGDGKAWSETRFFTLQKGLSFERPRYGVTIPREYGQVMPVTVRNNSDHPLEVVLECLPPDDKELLVGFVGEGSEDRPVHLPPGEIRQYSLSLSAQDCIHELHRFLVRIRSKDGYGDQAEVEVRVNIPKVDLQWEELEANPDTLGKKLRLVNKGDGLTDLTVRTAPVGAFRLRPTVEHALLLAGASVELWVDPVLFEGFKNVNGEVKIETFGKTFSHKLECAVPEGMQVYKVTVDPTSLDAINSWFCTNKPVIQLVLCIFSYLERLSIGEVLDYIPARPKDLEEFFKTIKEAWGLGLPRHKGQTRPSFFTLRKSPSLLASEKIREQQGTVDDIEIISKRKVEDLTFYKIKFINSKEEGWITGDAINIVPDFDFFLKQLKSMEVENNTLVIDERITKLRQMAHNKDLPFDDIIGKTPGNIYLDDLPFDQSNWQLFTDYNDVRMPDGKVVDIYHVLVGLDVLSNKIENQAYWGYDVGRNYSACLWSGDLGSASLDATIGKANEWEKHNSNASFSKKADFYFQTRVPDSQSLATVDSWGLNEKRLTHKYLNISVLLNDYYSSSNIASNRKEALAKFKEGYNLKTDSPSKSQTPEFDKMKDEVTKFANAFSKKRLGIMGSYDKNLTDKYATEMTKKFLDWVDKTAKEYDDNTPSK